MKTKEELSALKKEVETLNKKLAELSEEELAQVSGGRVDGTRRMRCFGDCYGNHYNCTNRGNGLCPYGYT